MAFVLAASAAFHHMTTRFSLRAANGQEYPISGPFRIGREPECQIQIDNRLISRIHASIWIDHDHLLLRDERSRNGTQLNGEPLTPGAAHYLHHDDEVQVGDAVFTVVSDPPYPRPRQHRGLPGLAEDEPPPTTPVDKPGPAPAPPPPSAAASAPVLRVVRGANPAPLPAGGLNPLAGPNVFAPDRIVAPPSPAPAAPAAPAPPRRSMTLPLAIGGCLALVLLAACCALGFVAITVGGPVLGTALAPPVPRTVTPAPANAADAPYSATPQPAAEHIATVTQAAAGTATAQAAGVFTLNGTFNLVQTDSGCQFTDAPHTTGTFQLNVDFNAGTAAGTMQGGGGGTRSLRCQDDTGDMNWQQTYSVSFAGTVDKASGALLLPGKLTGSNNVTWSLCAHQGTTTNCPAGYAHGYSFKVTVTGSVDKANGTGSGTWVVNAVGLPTSGDWSGGR